MDPLINKNVGEGIPLPSANQMKKKFPLSDKLAEQVVRHREMIEDIIFGRDDRLMVIVGPCSVHDPVAVLDYANRLANLRDAISNRLLIVMRLYPEKPRSVDGWKGILYDPDIEGTGFGNVKEGISRTRELAIKVLELGLPIACEVLNSQPTQYFDDLYSYEAIGARSSTSQPTRELASAVTPNVGIKHGPFEPIKHGVNSVKSATREHGFFSCDADGNQAIFPTKGNHTAHLILRGNLDQEENFVPNYDAESVAKAVAELQRQECNDRVVIDCSHANSEKDHTRQPAVLQDVVNQVLSGNRHIAGVMLESFIEEGNQKPGPLSELTYGQSITDKCMSWVVTEELLFSIADQLLDGGNVQIASA